jgi:hypothetical protein
MPHIQSAGRITLGFQAHLDGFSGDGFAPPAGVRIPSAGAHPGGRMRQCSPGVYPGYSFELNLARLGWHKQ